MMMIVVVVVVDSFFFCGAIFLCAVQRGGEPEANIKSRDDDELASLLYMRK